MNPRNYTDEEELERFNRSEDRTITKLVVDVAYIKDSVKEIKESLEDDYVTQDQFDPIKKVVYWGIGVCGTVLLAVILAIVSLVVKK